VGLVEDDVFERHVTGLFAEDTLVSWLSLTNM